MGRRVWHYGAIGKIATGSRERCAGGHDRTGRGGREGHCGPVGVLSPGRPKLTALRPPARRLHPGRRGLPAPRPHRAHGLLQQRPEPAQHDGARPAPTPAPGSRAAAAAAAELRAQGRPRRAVREAGPGPLRPGWAGGALPPVPGDPSGPAGGQKGGRAGRAGGALEPGAPQRRGRFQSSGAPWGARWQRDNNPLRRVSCTK